MRSSPRPFSNTQAVRSEPNRAYKGQASVPGSVLKHHDETNSCNGPEYYDRTLLGRKFEVASDMEYTRHYGVDEESRSST
jgi:hypothetical protein